jgi:hypothetical protein
VTAARAEQPAVSLGRLWFGLVAAPLAWSAAEIGGYIAAGRSCTAAWPNGRAFGFVEPRLWVVVIVAALAVLGIAGLLVAIANVRGAAPAAGRALFMAKAGRLDSSLFLVGNLFFTLPALITNLCQSAR